MSRYRSICEAFFDHQTGIFVPFREFSNTFQLLGFVRTALYKYAALFLLPVFSTCSLVYKQRFVYKSPQPTVFCSYLPSLSSCSRMTIAPQTQNFYHHPRSSSNQFAKDLDFLHQLSAQVPETSVNQDINNNDMGYGDSMEICCHTNFRPSRLDLQLNGDQLQVFGASERKAFGETFLLPENVDPNNIFCQMGRDNRLSISMHQMAFEANNSSSPPFASAKSGGLW